MLGVFRKVAMVEGITTLALFFVAMPMKYLAGDPRLVPPVGLLHGIAFLVYLAVMVAALRGRGFTAGEWLRTAAASFVPFGTFLNDPFLKGREASLTVRSTRQDAGAA
jgi:integral membrane protein